MFLKTIVSKFRWNVSSLLFTPYLSTGLFLSNISTIEHNSPVTVSH